jgi:hypothetical protein
MWPPALTYELLIVGKDTTCSDSYFPIPSHYIGRHGLRLTFRVGKAPQDWRSTPVLAARVLDGPKPL